MLKEIQLVPILLLGACCLNSTQRKETAMRFTKAMLLASLGLAIALGAGGASAQNTGQMPASLAEHLSNNAKAVWGGGAKEGSSYSGKIVPVVIEQLASERLAGYSWAGISDGTVMNAMMVTVNPTHLALGQADILATLNGEEIPGTSWRYSFSVVQEDIADECLYLVTKSPHYTTWGHVLENAWDASIATGGDQSGSYGTLTRVLMERYPDLQDAQVVSVSSTLQIVESVVNGGTNFGFFVMRPDSKNSVFEMINEHGLTLVPVIDFDLEDIYRFKSLKVSNAGWFGGAAKYHETACTQVQLITGNPKMLSEEQSRQKSRLEATIQRVSSIDSDAFKQAVVAQFTSWQDYLDAVRDIGGERLQQLLDASRAKIGEIAN